MDQQQEMIIKAVTIFAALVALIMLLRGKRRRLKAPIALWLLHIIIYHTSTIFLYSNGQMEIETARLLNAWSMSIRLQAIITIIAVLAYLRSFGGSATEELSAVLHERHPDESSIPDWLEGAMRNIPTLGESITHGN